MALKVIYLLAKKDKERTHTPRTLFKVNNSGKKCRMNS